jgi:hypothetical protein
LADSPVGLAAFMLDHDARSYKLSAQAFDGNKNVSIPAAVSVFPDELYQAPRSWAERAYPKLVHYNTLDKGGHFAAASPDERGG